MCILYLNFYTRDLKYNIVMFISDKFIFTKDVFFFFPASKSMDSLGKTHQPDNIHQQPAN